MRRGLIEKKKALDECTRCWRGRGNNGEVYDELGLEGTRCLYIQMGGPVGGYGIAGHRKKKGKGAIPGYYPTLSVHSHIHRPTSASHTYNITHPIHK